MKIYPFALSVLVPFLAGCSSIQEGELTATEKRIANTIDEANYCEIDADCALAGSKCPFGCYLYVNKERVEEISALVEGYESTCTYSCLRMDSVKCVQNKCEASEE